MELGFVVKPKNGWYAKVNMDTGEVDEKSYRLAQTDSDDFWNGILGNPLFKQKVQDKYQYNTKSVISEPENIESIYKDDDQV